MPVTSLTLQELTLEQIDERGAFTFVQEVTPQLENSKHKRVARGCEAHARVRPCVASRDRGGRRQ